MFVEKPEIFTLKLISKNPFASIVYKYKCYDSDLNLKRHLINVAYVLDYTIIENKIDADTDSQEFINHINDILVVLLDEN